MREIKVAIIDDEHDVLETLTSYFGEYHLEHRNNTLFQIQRFESAERFIESYQFFYNKGFKYDLILLDIEMHEMDGMSAAHKIREFDKEVIIMFVTNMAQYAIQGYAVEALDFIVKPVSYDAFTFRIRKALKLINNRKIEYITLDVEGENTEIDVADIYYVEVDQHHLIYHLENETIKIRGVLSQLEKQLAKVNFVRSNHCYLVNMKHISKIEGHFVTVGPYKLQISRNKKGELLKRLNQYVGGRRI